MTWPVSWPKAIFDCIWPFPHRSAASPGGASTCDVKWPRLARGAGRNARAGAPRDAAADAEVVLLAVPWSRLDHVLKQAGDLSGKIILSCSLPMNADDTGLALGRETSGSEELARRFPDGHVVAAFSTVPSEVLFGVFESRKRKRPSLVYCGDDARAKQVAAGLIRDAGFDPIDAGPLRIARYTEPFSLLIGQLAYEGSESPALAYRFERNDG